MSRVYALVVTLVIGVTLGASANLLQNPGLEDGSLASWGNEWNWRASSWGDDVHNGSWSAVNDVTTESSEGYRVLSQLVPVTAGQAYDGDAWLRIASFENSGEAWLELQWLNGAGDIMWGSGYESAHAGANQNYSYLYISNAIAPVGATTASVRGVVHVTQAPTVDTDYYMFDDFGFGQAVPEPGVLMMIGLGVGTLMAVRRRSV
jgi:hypothetical protein